MAHSTSSARDRCGTHSFNAQPPLLPRSLNLCTNLMYFCFFFTSEGARCFHHEQQPKRRRTCDISHGNWWISVANLSLAIFRQFDKRRRTTTSQNACNTAAARGYLFQNTVAPVLSRSTLKRNLGKTLPKKNLKQRTDGSYRTKFKSEHCCSNDNVHLRHWEYLF